MNLIYPNSIYMQVAGLLRDASQMTKSVFTDAYNALLDLMIAVRNEAGVSQAELARRLSRPQPFISYIERGERRLDVIEFYAIAKALDLDPAVLFARLLISLPDQVDI